MKSTFCWLLFSALCYASSDCVAAQVDIEIHGCKLSGHDYTCDKDNFHQVLAAAKTVSVEAPGSDPYSLKQMEELARSLGKVVRSNSPDLTFVLAHGESNGIDYGPDDRKLASIRVYYRGPRGNPGRLVWVENYYGQPNTPWLITVDHLSEQIRNEFKR